MSAPHKPAMGTTATNSSRSVNATDASNGALGTTDEDPLAIHLERYGDRFKTYIHRLSSKICDPASDLNKLANTLEQSGNTFKDSMKKFAQDVRGIRGRLNAVRDENRELKQHRELDRAKIQGLLDERTWTGENVKKVAELMESNDRKVEEIHASWLDAQKVAAEWKCRAEELERQHEEDKKEIKKLRMEVLQLAGIL